MLNRRQWAQKRLRLLREIKEYEARLRQMVAFADLFEPRARKSFSGILGALSERARIIDFHRERGENLFLNGNPARLVLNKFKPYRNWV